MSGRIKPTILSRISKGYGAISNILAITNEVPLAHWRIEAGLKLRQAMFLNGTLFNSEAWQGISPGEIEMIDMHIIVHITCTNSIKEGRTETLHTSIM